MGDYIIRIRQAQNGWYAEAYDHEIEMRTLVREPLFRRVHSDLSTALADIAHDLMKHAEEKKSG